MELDLYPRLKDPQAVAALKRQSMAAVESVGGFNLVDESQLMTFSSQTSLVSAAV